MWSGDRALELEGIKRAVNVCGELYSIVYKDEIAQYKKQVEEMSAEIARLLDEQNME